MPRSLNVVSFGWVFPSYDEMVFFADEVTRHEDDDVVLVQADDVQLRVYEHARVRGIENSMLTLGHHADAVRVAGRRARFLDSSITNTYRRDVTPDFVPYVMGLAMAMPRAVFVIGSCLGAGLLRVQALPARVRRCTLVTAWDIPCAHEDYLELGVLGVVTRRCLTRRLVALAPAPTPVVEALPVPPSILSATLFDRLHLPALQPSPEA